MYNRECMPRGEREAAALRARVVQHGRGALHVHSMRTWLLSEREWLILLRQPLSSRYCVGSRRCNVDFSLPRMSRWRILGRARISNLRAMLARHVFVLGWC